MPDQRDPSSLAANLLLLGGSLLMTALIVASLEGALRLAGLGAPDAARASRLKYQQIYLPILEPGERPDGTAVLRTTDARLPYQAILAEKPANALRIVTLGGSATAGLGFSPNVTFARELERMLEDAYPEHVIEVLNLGIVALAARQVQVLVEDVCRNYDADGIVVYSGNNEFLEVHAEKFAMSQATLLTKMRDQLIQTNLYRLVDRAVRGGPQTPSLAAQNISRSDLGMTENELIQEVEMLPEEIEEIVERYGKTIDAIAQVAGASETPLVLMTVASNWEWRGREDLPENWLDELVPPDAGSEETRYRRAIELLTEKIASAPESDRSPWLFKRAAAAAAISDWESARADYRAAMNTDPHLRRALDSMGDRVRSVAQRRKTPLVDAVEQLSLRAQHGIVGFDEFYDYVHFTPRGALLVASAAFESLVANGIVPPPDNFDLENFARERLAQQAAQREDPLDVREWLGFGFDPSGIGDRNLWKYDSFVIALDERISAQPDDVRALVYRGNANAFRVDGAAQAERDYRAALEISDDPAIRANLDRLLAGRRP